ncbi:MULTISPECIES: hypothetical protein [Pseudomonas]|uniref:hypothetical protein n=1 Tax=Pseudomonas TaxID=286 RepID=UPI0008B75EBF|nr:MULTISPECIES: hypothetical protein [Pseudomonas]SEQ46529.1 hypothetical protein SAMN03159354_01735 [Pseudomonas sp. NFPP19]
MKTSSKIFLFSSTITITIVLSYGLLSSNTTDKTTTSTMLNFEGTGIDKDVKISKYDNSNVKESSTAPDNWLSTAQIDKDTIAIASYKNIILLNKSRKSVCEVKPEWQSDLAIKKTWTPTGLFFTNKTLYIANQTGNNILTGNISPEDCTFTVETSIQDDSGRGPKNIFVDSFGNIYSANHDSDNLIAFNKNGNKIWTSELRKPHGITADEHFIYATSLANKNIQKLNKNTGESVLSQGKSGWNMQNGEYLWPTSITNSGEGKLLVSDAHSGMIGLLDSNTLSPLQTFGGLGPGLNYFSYPYSAVLNQFDEILVTSSMRASIYIYNLHNLQLKEIITPVEQGWASSKKYKSQKFGNDWTNYQNTAAPSQYFFGKRTTLGFGRLYNHDGSLTTYKVPEPNELVWNIKPNLDFLQSKKIDNDTLLFSSSTSQALLYTEQKPSNLLIPVKLPSQDNWLVNDKVISNGKFLDQKDISSKKHDFIKKLDSLRNSAPLTVSDVASLYATADNTDLLDSSFKSFAGKSFYNFWRYCSISRSCSKNELQDMAWSFFRRLDSNHEVSLGEAALVSLISEKNWTDTTSVKLQSCGAGKYYKGYEPETIKPGDLSHYISAVDISGSELCITSTSPSTAAQLKIFWLNRNEVPNLVKITSTNEKGFAATINHTINDENLHLSSRLGTPYSIIPLPESHGPTTFSLTLGKGAAQNRLLIRNIELVSGKAEKIKPLDVEGQKFYGTHHFPRSILESNKAFYGNTPKKDDVLHCGHFAARYVYENCYTENCKWRILGLRNGLANHTIVEVKENNNWKIKDPTLGYKVSCSFTDIQGGNCLPDESSITGAKKWDTRFSGYAPQDFLPNADILSITWGTGKITEGVLYQNSL